MAKCDEGYLCLVCGEEVKRIDQSELYLKYVVGWIDGNQLNSMPERHLHCNPALAQFVLEPKFQALEVDSGMKKAQLDHDFRVHREALLTAGYERLKFLQKHRREMKIEDYPLNQQAIKSLTQPSHKSVDHS